MSTTDMDLMKDNIKEFIEIDNNTSYKSLGNCPDLLTTPFATKIELSADYQGSCIILVSNELFGSAKNLIKTTANYIKHEPRKNEEGNLF